MPSPKKNERQKDFVSRCMSSEESKRSFPDTKQRVAFCHSQWKSKGEDANSHILNRAELTHGDEFSDKLLKTLVKKTSKEEDEKSGSPPNCNEGYHEEDGKCVPNKRKKN